MKPPPEEATPPKRARASCNVGFHPIELKLVQNQIAHDDNHAKSHRDDSHRIPVLEHCGGASGFGRVSESPGKLPEHRPKSENTIMLMIIAIILLFLWVLGLVTSTTMGGIIHILLMAAIIIVVVKEIWDREIT